MRASKRLKIGATILTVLLVVAVALCVRQEQGYFSPIYSVDGHDVYFIERSTWGMVLGLGWEFFTPSATVHLWRDRFALCRMKSDGSTFEVLEELPTSPLEDRTISQYRGRIFTVPSVALHLEGQQVQYEVAIDLPKQPYSGTSILRGQWPGARDAAPTASAWTAGSNTISGSEDVLREPWELVAVRGGEGYPCAIIAHNDSTSELRILKKTRGCERNYDGGIRWEHLAEYSRAKDIRRLRTLLDTRTNLISDARAQGLAEGEALLQADRKLEDIGYYPKPPRYIAHEVDDSSDRAAAPVFRISEMEFKVVLFPDIEKAIATPGTEVEKSMGNYLTHRDYDTSRRLNDFLATGGKRFFVERAGRSYELVLTDERPAYR